MEAKKQSWKKCKAALITGRPFYFAGLNANHGVDYISKLASRSKMEFWNKVWQTALTVTEHECSLASRAQEGYVALLRINRELAGIKT
jgi:beta-mannanase